MSDEAKNQPCTSDETTSVALSQVEVATTQLTSDITTQQSSVVTLSQRVSALETLHV
jgi:hypothetical protein